MLGRLNEVMHVSAQPGALHVISTQYMLVGLFTIMISTSNAFLHVSEAYPSFSGELRWLSIFPLDQVKNLSHS